MKKLMGLGLTLCLLAVLSGCKGSSPVFVQSVAELSGFGGIAPGDRFSAMVVSEHTTEIKKDADKTIEEVFVREGDDVEEGQALFSYDMDELQLSYDKLVLQRDQLSASIDSYTAQIAQLERESYSVWGNNRLQYTIQIQSTQVDLKEAQINLKSKEAEVERAEALLENSTVTAPTAGRIQSIHESGTDANGNPTAFITIQEAGAYRVKGVINELQRGGISEGQRIRMTSRVNPEAVWYGEVTLVDYENPIQSNGNFYGAPTDEMSASSKYPFYVALDSTDGLMMGQHLYLELDSGEGTGGIRLDASFIVTEGENAYVWAEHRGKLEKRTVTLGDLDELDNTYPILSGLSLNDYIAFPDPAVCRAGAPTTRVLPQPSEDAGEFAEDMPMEFDEGMPEDFIEEMPADFPEEPAQPEQKPDEPLHTLEVPGMPALSGQEDGAEEPELTEETAQNEEED